MDIKNEHRSGHPKWAATDKNIPHVEDMVISDRR